MQGRARVHRIMRTAPLKMTEALVANRPDHRYPARSASASGHGPELVHHSAGSIRSGSRRADSRVAGRRKLSM